MQNLPPGPSELLERKPRAWISGRVYHRQSLVVAPPWKKSRNGPKYEGLLPVFDDRDAVAVRAIVAGIMPRVAWRWSSPVASMRETHAGVAFATIDARKPDDVLVFAAIRGRATLALLSRPGGRPIDALQCVVGNESRAATSAAVLFEGKSLPLQYEQRFNRTHVESAAMKKDLGEGHAEWVFASVRLRCPSLGPLPMTGRMLSLQLRNQWVVPDIIIQPAGFPMVEAFADVDGGISHTAATEPAVTVCVQYVYGAGYAMRRVLEFASYYLHLGAKRIVVFDSMEPELARGDAAARVRAARRAHGLQTIASALGSSFQLVRGFCTHDTMLRTTLNQNCQVLAGNACLNAARSVDSTAPSAHVLMVDLDEYLTPPLPGLGAVAEAEPRLKGALLRMARQVAAGHAVTSAPLAEQRAEWRSNDRPKVEGWRSGSCVKFASVYFAPPRCSDALYGGNNEGGFAAISYASDIALLRLSRLVGTDHSEPGPSHRWRNITKWDYRVRAKFLMDARNPYAVSAIHSCCHPAGMRAHPPPESACAMVDHVPREEWHVRHLRNFDEPCRTEAMSTLEIRNGEAEEHPLVWAANASLHDVPLPPSWAVEVRDAVQELHTRIKHGK